MISSDFSDEFLGTTGSAWLEPEQRGLHRATHHLNLLTGLEVFFGVAQDISISSEQVLRCAINQSSLSHVAKGGRS